MIEHIHKYFPLYRNSDNELNHQRLLWNYFVCRYTISKASKLIDKEYNFFNFHKVTDPTLKALKQKLNYHFVKTTVHDKFDLDRFNAFVNENFYQKETILQINGLPKDQMMDYVFQVE